MAQVKEYTRRTKKGKTCRVASHNRASGGKMKNVRAGAGHTFTRPKISYTQSGRGLFMSNNR